MWYLIFNSCLILLNSKFFYKSFNFCCLLIIFFASIRLKSLSLVNCLKPHPLISSRSKRKPRKPTAHIPKRLSWLIQYFLMPTVRLVLMGPFLIIIQKIGWLLEPISSRCKSRPNLGLQKTSREKGLFCWAWT